MPAAMLPALDLPAKARRALQRRLERLAMAAIDHAAMVPPERAARWQGWGLAALVYAADCHATVPGWRAAWLGVRAAYGLASPPAIAHAAAIRARVQAAP